MMPLFYRSTAALVAALLFTFLIDTSVFTSINEEVVKFVVTIVSFLLYISYLVRSYILIYKKFQITMKAFGTKKYVNNLTVKKVAKQQNGYSTYKVSGKVHIGEQVVPVSKYIYSMAAININEQTRLYSYFDPQDISNKTFYFDVDSLKKKK
jgi:hypothetical protein